MSNDSKLFFPCVGLFDYLFIFKRYMIVDMNSLVRHESNLMFCTDQCWWLPLFGV